MNVNAIVAMFLICLFALLTYTISESVFFAVGSVFVLPVAFRYKNQAFLMFIAFSYFRFHEAFPMLISLKIPKMLAFIAIIVFMLDVFIKEKKIDITKENKILLLILAYIPINIALSTSPTETLTYFTDVYIKILLMAFIISLSIKTKEDLKNLSRMIIIGGTIISLVTLYNKINGIGLIEETRVTISRDIQSILGDPNDLALIILFPLSFALASFTIKMNNLKKVIYALIICLMISAILATKSRGGLLGMLCVLLLFVYEQASHKKTVLFFAITFGSIILLGFGMLERVGSDNMPVFVDASAQGRITAWNAAIEMTKDNPIFGIGIDRFIHNYYLYTDYWDGKYHETHSTWLKALSEGGIVFFTLFMMLVWQTGKRILETRKKIKNPKENVFFKHYNALHYGFAGFLISSTFLTQTYTWPIYIIWSMSIGLMVVIDKTIKEESQLKKEG